MRKGTETDDVLLQQQNTRPHTSAATIDAIAHLGLIVLPHPAYSPDLTPSDFHLFHKLKKDLRGQNFRSDEEVKAGVRQWFWEKERFLLRRGFKNLLNTGKNVLKLEETIGKTDYTKL
jgi:histone-lysine N-methyltransferase SETMAR